MAKSISRHTYLLSKKPEYTAECAKTTRDILNGYYNSSDMIGLQKEQEVVASAILDYSQYAERIFVSVGVGDISIEQVRSRVEQHIRLTGKRPVVIVDYVQIMAPPIVRDDDGKALNRSLTDKQAVDKDVL